MLTEDLVILSNLLVSFLTNKQNFANENSTNLQNDHVNCSLKIDELSVNLSVYR